MNAMRWQGGVFSVLALLTSIACGVLPPADPKSVLVWVGLLIVLLGVPHGALDPIYARAWPGIQGRAAWVFFVWSYLLLATWVVAVWWRAPTFFLWGFLTISVLHFSGDLAAGTPLWTRFFYGGAVIVLPAALHADELTRLFALLTNPESAAWVVPALQVMVWPWLVALLLAVVLSARRDAFVSLEVLAVCILALTAPPLIGFTVFFCAMHSPRHMLRTQVFAGMTLQALAAVALWPMLGVFLMAAGAWYGLPDSSLDARMVQFIFVALAALTVPHMLLVERVRWKGWT
jgi:Brp/Blh family beta-carotene 15,15'-monooxygenase